MSYMHANSTLHLLGECTAVRLSRDGRHPPRRSRGMDAGSPKVGGHGDHQHRPLRSKMVGVVEGSATTRARRLYLLNDASANKRHELGELAEAWRKRATSYCRCSSVVGQGLRR